MMASAVASVGREPLPPLVRLPKSELSLWWKPDAPYVAVKAHTRDLGRGRAIYALKMKWADFPNDIVDLDDLRRLGAYETYLDWVNRPAG
jgi:hypothetical protein